MTGIIISHGADEMRWSNKTMLLLVLIVTIVNRLASETYYFYKEPTISSNSVKQGERNFDLKAITDSFKGNAYSQYLGLDTLFAEDSMFWGYYQDSYDLFKKYYLDDIYKTTLPMNITIRVNLSGYVQDNHFMYFSMPLDLETNPVISNGIKYFRDIFLPNYRSSSSKLRGN